MYVLNITAYTIHHILLWYKATGNPQNNIYMTTIHISMDLYSISHKIATGSMIQRGYIIHYSGTM